MRSPRAGAARLVLAAALALVTTAACGGDEDPEPGASASGSEGESPSPEPSEDEAEASHKPKIVGTIAENLKSPWGLAFLPDGSALVSLRDSGEIKRVTEDGDVTDVGKVPGAVHSGEGGLMGLAIPPDFDSKPRVYAYMTTEEDNRIVRMSYSEDDGLGRPEVVFDGIKKADIHNGGALLFGPDKMLYAGTGDANVEDSGQDDASPNGKILRMTPDGEVPEDNPNPESLAYSKGHRNVQGLAFDKDKRLWASEFGQNEWDELNYIRPGKNYGWPVVEGTDGLDRYANPVRKWNPDEASPSGIAWAGGSVWMASLKGERLWEIGTGSTIVEDDNPITLRPRDWFNEEYGRLRTVVPAPDGTLWLVTNNTDGRGDPKDGDDKILKMELGDIHTDE